MSQLLNNLVRQLGISATVNVQNNQNNILESRVNVSSQFGNYLISAGLNATQPSISNLDANVSFSLGDVLGLIWLEQTRVEADITSSEVGTETFAGMTQQSQVVSVRVGAGDLFRGLSKRDGAILAIVFKSRKNRYRQQ